MTKVKSFSLLTSLVVSFLVTTSVWAGGIARINDIKISGLDHFRGQLLTAFYTNARPSGLGTAGSQPRVREVLKIAGPFEIHGNGETVNIPKTTVTVEGYKTFNYIYFVVHSPYLDEVGIRNIDGTIPAGQNLQRANAPREDSNNPFNHSYVFFASQLDLSSEADKSTGFINLTVNPKLVNFVAPVGE
jgi:hypothetical protein